MGRSSEEGRERDQLLKVSGAPRKEGTTTTIHEPINQRRSESAQGRIQRHDFMTYISRLANSRIVAEG